MATGGSTVVSPTGVEVAATRARVSTGLVALDIPLGSGALPGLAFRGDRDTGVFRPAADEIGFATGGTERVRIDSTGVGIGTVAAPTNSLEIFRSGDVTTIRMRSGFVAHGMTGLGAAFNPTPTTDTFAQLQHVSTTGGGLMIVGMGDLATTTGIMLHSIMGVDPPTQPAIFFRASKKSGATNQALANTETLASFQNSSGPTRLINIMGSGNLGVGVDDPGETRTTDGVRGIVHLGNAGTVPAGTLNGGGALFYATAGEMHVIDASGNDTTISPHSKTGEWVYRSKRNGRGVKIHMERLVRKLEEKFGWGMIEEFVSN